MSFAISNLSKKYARTNVLDHLDLTLPEKGIIGLFGPSGCGKTTLLHILAGLVHADSGNIDGILPDQVSMVFQEDRLLPWMTAANNLNLAFSDVEKTRLWLTRMQLLEAQDVYPDELSGGMKRRLALARGLGFPAKLLLLDEPFKGLDLHLKNRIYPFVRQIAEEQLVLLVTHDPGEILSLTDQILLAIGPPLKLEPIDRDTFASHWTQVDA